MPHLNLYVLVRGLPVEPVVPLAAPKHGSSVKYVKLVKCVKFPWRPFRVVIFKHFVGLLYSTVSHIRGISKSSEGPLVPCVPWCTVTTSKTLRKGLFAIDCMTVSKALSRSCCSFISQLEFGVGKIEEFITLAHLASAEWRYDT